MQSSHREKYSAKSSAAKKADSFCNVALQQIGLPTEDTWKFLILLLCIVLCYLIYAEPLHLPPHGYLMCHLLVVIISQRKCDYINNLILAQA